MRRNNGVLNPALSRVISETGHTDRIVVTDAGLPLPKGVERIDLALVPGIPAFLDVLDAVLAELEVEAVTAAEEVKSASPDMAAEIERRFAERQIPVTYVPHSEFKTQTAEARAAVRSGEFTSFANVILHAGVCY